MRKYAAKRTNPCKHGKPHYKCESCLAIRDREWRLKTKYGISLESYFDLLEFQRGICAICGVTEPAGMGQWHVDHDHETNEVRGLLCLSCNTKLAWVEKLQANILNYLKSPPNKRRDENGLRSHNSQGE